MGTRGTSAARRSASETLVCGPYTTPVSHVRLPALTVVTNSAISDAPKSWHDTHTCPHGLIDRNADAYVATTAKKSLGARPPGSPDGTNSESRCDIPLANVLNARAT